METVIKNFIIHELVRLPEQFSLENDTPLVESGILDSLSLLKLLLFLEERFNVKMEDFDITSENFDSIDAICAYIRSRQGLQVS